MDVLETEADEYDDDHCDDSDENMMMNMMMINVMRIFAPARKNGLGRLALPQKGETSVAYNHVIFKPYHKQG